MRVLLAVFCVLPTLAHAECAWVLRQKPMVAGTPAAPVGTVGDVSWVSGPRDVQLR
jgi:hypothetical protein